MKRNNIFISSLVLLTLFTINLPLVAEGRQELKGCIDKTTGRFTVSKRCNRNEMQFSERTFSSKFSEIQANSNESTTKLNDIIARNDLHNEAIIENARDIQENLVEITKSNIGIDENFFNLSVNAGNIATNSENIAANAQAVYHNANTALGNLQNIITLSTAIESIPAPTTIIHVASSGAQFTKISKAIEEAKRTLPSYFHRVQIKVAPGLYFEIEPIVLGEYVSIEGSGVGVTELNSAADVAIELANKSSISNLTITHTPTASFSTIKADSLEEDVHIKNISINCTANTENGSSLSLNESNIYAKDISLSISGNSAALVSGVDIKGGVLNLENININITQLNATGINVDNNANITTKNGSIIINSTKSVDAIGISINGLETKFLGKDTDLFLNNKGSNSAVSVTTSTDVEFERLNAKVEGVSSSLVMVDDSGNLEIRNSSIMSDREQTTLNVKNSSTISIGNSKLAGGDVIDTDGSINCAAIYDENYSFSQNSCF